MSLDDFWKLANAKGFVNDGKLVAKHSEMLTWLNARDIGLEHVHASFLIGYLMLRADDPKVSTRMRESGPEGFEPGIFGDEL